MPEEKKRWFGDVPAACELCKKPMTGNVFFDAVVRVHTRNLWALVCETCHRHFGVGLGTGKGQKYDLTTMAKLEG